MEDKAKPRHIRGFVVGRDILCLDEIKRLYNMGR
jgi:hypothetical protein